MTRDLDDAAMEATYWREVFKDLAGINEHIAKIAEGMSSAVVTYGMAAVALAFTLTPEQTAMFDRGMDGLVTAMDALSALQSQIGSLSEVASGRIPVLTDQIEEARGSD